MSIVTARRISQIFFFLLFLWFCIVTTLGERWWQLRGWPVNWLIQLDPLVGLGTLLATGTLYAGLLWGLLTVILTILLGRFFCGWICPFGALHQAVGWVANRRCKASAMIAANRYRRGQGVKYAILVFLLGAAAGDNPGLTCQFTAKFLMLSGGKSLESGQSVILRDSCGMQGSLVKRPLQ